MSNSGLVNYTAWSPNYSSRHGARIDKITIHHMAGNLSVETCGNVFANRSREASSTYGVDGSGRIGQYVDEAYRPWTSSSYYNDRRAVTIEVANDQIGGNWHVSAAALESTIRLCVDICKRNGMPGLYYDGTPNGSLTRHNMFAATNCPGPYLQSLFPYIAEEVTRRVKGGQSTPAPSTPKPQSSVSSIAKEVIQGLWGNGETRMSRLRAAGYDASAVQAEVNRILGGGSTPAPAPKVDVTTLAQQVLRGVWGNGSDRKARLEAAGHNYSAVQAEVNRLCGLTAPKPQPVPSKSVSELAKEVMAGNWGNGQDRMNRLAAAGYNAAAVQAEVNRLCNGGQSNSYSISAIADQVIRGEWGNGQDRYNRLTAAGYNAQAVQAEVNRKLR